IVKQPRPEEMLSKVIERLEAKGYSDDLRACPEGLRAIGSGKTYAPEALVIDEVARFEGVSDPDDEAVVFALRSPQEGPIGTYVVPFGPAMQPPDADIVHRLRHAASIT
ncbi:MAG TPA: hypothetical protein VFB62_05120, partial [Polyangiaceae bacterium]|nr:hypothetical protein [Polyangiaceae bacterium]